MQCYCISFDFPCLLYISRAVISHTLTSFDFTCCECVALHCNDLQCISTCSSRLYSTSFHLMPMKINEVRFVIALCCMSCRFTCSELFHCIPPNRMSSLVISSCLHLSWFTYFGFVWLCFIFRHSI